MKLTEVSRLYRHKEFMALENPTVQDWVERYMGFPPADYSIVDGRININDNLRLDLERIGRGDIPFPLGKIRGDFEMTEQLEVTSLKNGPTAVTGDFDVSNTNITSLEYGPKNVGGEYNIHKCRQLLSLKGMPKGKLNGIIDARSCRKLTNLEGITPEFYSGNFQDTGITSLVGVSSFIKKIRDNIIFDWEKIKEGGLGLLLIEGNFYMQGISSLKDGHKPFYIIRKYWNQKERIFDCQAELIDNGFEEYAKL